ncbi:sensor histidine kinase [Promicromonospora sukumoe]|uniref:sensor histidine kinase n=1 Tax=Promicromonospora sukumoe TaxID=88382 RepID=UPI00037572CB|nr:histidine kinase [Promicromonospora sukumoe]
MPRLSELIAPVVKVVTAEDRRGDMITAGGILVTALALDALGLIRTSWSGLPDVPSWWFAIPAAIGCTALIWRRIHPLAVLGVATVAFVLDVVLGGSVGLIVVLWEALYAVHLHGTRTARRVSIVGVTILTAALMTVIAVVTGGLRPTVLVGLQALTLLVMPMWWGTNVRQGRELTAAARERERLERERGAALLRLAEASRHDAVRAERATVARDLHDVVASHLSAIAITSGGALAGAAEPDRDRAALRSIRAESLASLQDMQAMIRVLRADDVGPEDVAPSRAAQLAPVIEQARLAGLDLAVSDPDGVLTGATPLPAAVDHAVYRVVREALTNVHRHGGARADLSFAAGGRLEIGVRDVGTGHVPGSHVAGDVGEGTGIGLVSMRERVESLGGSFWAGPEHAGPDEPPSSRATPGSGWLVRAVLPLPDRAGAGSVPEEPSQQQPAPQHPSPQHPSPQQPSPEVHA